MHRDMNLKGRTQAHSAYVSAMFPYVMLRANPAVDKGLGGGGWGIGSNWTALVDTQWWTGRIVPILPLEVCNLCAPPPRDMAAARQRTSIRTEMKRTGRTIGGIRPLTYWKNRHGSEKQWELSVRYTVQYCHVVWQFGESGLSHI
jgi:hypothetical protein